VAVSGRLILLSGLGSVVGPLIGASLMAHFTIDGVFYFMAAAALFLTFLAAGRSFTTLAPHHVDRPFEILAPQAATLAHAPLNASDELCRRSQSGLLPRTINSRLLSGAGILHRTFIAQRERGRQRSCTAAETAALGASSRSWPGS